MSASHAAGERPPHAFRELLDRALRINSHRAHGPNAGEPRVQRFDDGLTGWASIIDEAGARLARCAGFRTVAGGAVVGTVVEVRYEPSARWDQPSSLVVHDGHATRKLVVAVADVERLDPQRRLVLVRGRPDVAFDAPASWRIGSGRVHRADAPALG